MFLSVHMTIDHLYDHGELGFLLLVSHSVPFVFANSASVISENGELFLQSMLHGT